MTAPRLAAVVVLSLAASLPGAAGEPPATPAPGTASPGNPRLLNPLDPTPHRTDPGKVSTRPVAAPAPATLPAVQAPMRKVVPTPVGTVQER